MSGRAFGIGHRRVVIGPSWLTCWDGAARAFSFDAAGRLTLVRDLAKRRTFKRGLDHRVLLIELARGEPDPSARGAHPPARGGAGDGCAHRSYRDLAPPEKEALVRDALRVAKLLARDLARGAGVEIGVAPGGDRHAGVAAWLGRVLRWDAAALARDAARFRSVYKPVPILPPDQYGAVVLQVTEGCSYNRCTFCDFYRGRHFAAKTLPEVSRHIAAVQDFLGESAAGRERVFLADANALIAPQRLLVQVFELIRREFPTAAGVYSFMDTFGLRWKSRDELRELVQLGLRRVYLGLESASDPLRRFLAKPGTAAQALAAVADLKAAGAAVGVIVLVGAGGQAYAAEHVAQTLALLQRMSLGREDIVYLSPLVVHPGGEYERAAAAAGVRPLSEAEMASQLAAFRSGLRFADPRDRPRVARYDIRESIY